MTARTEPLAERPAWNALKANRRVSVAPIGVTQNRSELDNRPQGCRSHSACWLVGHAPAARESTLRHQGFVSSSLLRPATGSAKFSAP